MKKKQDVLAQSYVNANDLMILIDGLKYYKAVEYINQAQEIMKQENKFIPICKTKLASMKTIKKIFDF